MALIVEDTFTVGANEDLTAHTADQGGQWVQVALTGTRIMTILAAEDTVKISQGETAKGHLCKPGTAPAGAEYDVEYQITTVHTTAIEAPIGIFGRMTAGAGDYYRIRNLPTGFASNDTELMKMVGTTKTSLATVDTGLVANDVLLLEIRDAAKRVLKNGAEILTNGDNTITGAGDAGMGIGFIKTGDEGNANSIWRLDNFKVTEVDVGGQPTQHRTQGVPTGPGARDRIGRYN